ncbi:MAG: hypothetical protein M9904_11905 [Chitinophagaceae bacterium]|nr:hypothetical protein [Chitinophagaceae bacterium]
MPPFPACLFTNNRIQQRSGNHQRRRNGCNYGGNPGRTGYTGPDVPAGAIFERMYVNNVYNPWHDIPTTIPQPGYFSSTAPDAIAPERVKKWKDPAGGYVHALHAYEWGGFHYRITGTDSKGNLQMEGGWQNNRPNKMHEKYRFVENIFEELDSPENEFGWTKAKTFFIIIPHRRLI